MQSGSDDPTGPAGEEVRLSFDDRRDGPARRVIEAKKG
jgi:hypothetical protein